MPERGFLMKSRKGFTIIELVVVMAILAILSAFAYPRIAGYMELNQEKHRENHEYMVNKALMQYYALTGSYCNAPYMTTEPDNRMSDTDAENMVERLASKTGALIEYQSGKYIYIKTEGHDDPDNLSKCTIRAIEVRIP